MFSTTPAFLYVPADQPALLGKARQHRNAALILDLEDSVAPSRKEYALHNAIEFAQQGPHPGGTWVRINQGGQGISESAVLGAAKNLSGIWIPKAEQTQQVLDIAAVLPAAAAPRPRIGLLVESAKGVLALQELSAMKEVSQLQLGELDLGADLRHRARHAENMLLARQNMVLNAAAQELPAPIAPVEDNVVDLDGFRESSKKLRDAGFGGRACIHPAQVRIALEVFGISEEERSAAQQLLAHYEAATSTGQGVIRDDQGVMIDAASVRTARLVLGLRA
ncbi:CoA ester lyase [Pseudarthrobacter sp. GA104]|uniref:HpcH/HpaI aldolase/citrate lyase family protein n=1 Tax=Pseudarthrobacter sp. GA104 TaxID=2676311 RepID=UPI0012FA89A8|nr:aldolase/citrate lyase family protein [Pseudarthrobacter sp. GA104]MUU69702.1 CoA ester lyase [Pseudarthrobacter sp. GA104]